MIYCVIPETLAGELFDKLTDYYKDDAGVEVIVDRRKCERRKAGSSGGGKRELRDRRRRRPGTFPVEVPAASLRRTCWRRPNASSCTSTAARAATRARRRSACRGLRPRTATSSDRANAYIGEATNNEAEYRALLLGLDRARALGAPRSRSSTTPS